MPSANLIACTDIHSQHLHRHPAARLRQLPHSISSIQGSYRCHCLLLSTSEPTWCSRRLLVHSCVSSSQCPTRSMLALHTCPLLEGPRQETELTFLFCERTARLRPQASILPATLANRSFESLDSSPHEIPFIYVQRTLEHDMLCYLRELTKPQPQYRFALWLIRRR
jgi:hypothetical protein